MHISCFIPVKPGVKIDAKTLDRLFLYQNIVFCFCFISLLENPNDILTSHEDNTNNKRIKYVKISLTIKRYQILS